MFYKLLIINGMKLISPNVERKIGKYVFVEIIWESI